MPSGLDEQPAGVTVAVLVIDPCVREARRVLAGDQPDEGADGATGEPMPVTDLNGQRERGKRGNPAQAPQPMHDWGELGIRSHRLDLCIQACAQWRW